MGRVEGVCCMRAVDNERGCLLVVGEGGGRDGGKGEGWKG